MLCGGTFTSFAVLANDTRAGAGKQKLPGIAIQFALKPFLETPNGGSIRGNS